jgi:transcriptional regulator with XRE-family HTH domain
MPTHDVTDQALAYALRRLRGMRGSTQEDLAFSAGITVAALGRIERGNANPRWSTIRRIISALEISIAELATTVEEAPPTSRGRRAISDGRVDAV